MPATPQWGTDRGGVAEWLIVVVAVVVLVIGILVTNADEIIVDAIEDAWDIIRGEDGADSAN